jgi:stage V sporulation protein G
MEITEVKISLKEGPDKKLKAYATMTFDNSFVVRNVKIIKGTKGLFVAMPSRKLKESCPKCHYKNATRSRFCNQCGAGLPMPQVSVNPEERHSEHKDIAHPITLECREYIQKKVLDAYQVEAEGAGRTEELPKAPEREEPTPQPQVKPAPAELPQDETGDIKL